MDLSLEKTRYMKEYFTLLVSRKCSITASSGSSEKCTDVTLFSTMILRAITLIYEC